MDRVTKFYGKRDELLNKIQRYRRHEDRALDNSPRHGVADYAACIVAINTAVQVLNESIENKQLARTQAALELLELGTSELKLWAAHAGADV